jgi:hypothetical protein
MSESALKEKENELTGLIATRDVLSIRLDQVAKEVERLRIERAAEQMLGIPDADTLGESMTTSKLVAIALDKCEWAARSQFRELTPEQKADVEAGYRRHLAACESLEIAPEPRFLPEIIYDVSHDMHEPESFAMRVGA